MPQCKEPRPAAVYGIDIGKNIFHVVVLASDGVPVQKVRFRRDTLLQFFEQAAPANVGMESCAGSQWIAKKIQALGHKVRLILAQFVKPYVKSNETLTNQMRAFCLEYGIALRHGGNALKTRRHPRGVACAGQRRTEFIDSVRLKYVLVDIQLNCGNLL